MTERERDMIVLALMNFRGLVTGPLIRGCSEQLSARQTWLLSGWGSLPSEIEMNDLINKFRDESILG